MRIGGRFLTSFPAVLQNTILPSGRVTSGARRYRNWQRLLPFAAILFLELIVVVVAYQFLREIACSDFDRPGLCDAIRNGIGRALAVLALLVLYVPARRRAFAFLWEAGPTGALLPVRPLALMAAGLVVILLPLLIPNRQFVGLLLPFALLWAAGLALSVAGVLSAAGRPAQWLGALSVSGAELALLLGIALIAPELTGILNGAWGWPLLTDVTFTSVVRLLSLLPGELTVDRSDFVLGLDDFVVRVGEPCSGLQGFALILLMLTGYLMLYRDRLRMPHALLLLPVGLAASFLLNILRIAMLIWLGARVSPELAMDGFHSHAGWLLFTLLSFALIGLSLTVPQFRRHPASGARVGGVPLRRDRIAAMLVPLMMFLLSGLAVSTFVEVPDLAYAWRMAAMGAALLFFLPVWREMPWGTDAPSVLAGLAIGVVWAALDRPGGDPALTAGLAALPPLGLALWISARVAGTVLLVPLIEEAAFRGYLVGELAGRDRRWQAAAALLSALLFSTLHSNPALAFVAGIVFAGVFLRRCRLADAFWAHAAANLVVVAAAAASGDWGAI